MEEHHVVLLRHPSCAERHWSLFLLQVLLKEALTFVSSFQDLSKEGSCAVM